MNDVSTKAISPIRVLSTPDAVRAVAFSVTFPPPDELPVRASYLVAERRKHLIYQTDSMSLMSSHTPYSLLHEYLQGQSGFSLQNVLCKVLDQGGHAEDVQQPEGRRERDADLRSSVVQRVTDDAPLSAVHLDLRIVKLA